MADLESVHIELNSYIKFQRTRRIKEKESE